MDIRPCGSGSSFGLNALFHWGYRSFTAGIDFTRFVDLALVPPCFHKKAEARCASAKRDSGGSRRLSHAAQTLAAIGQMDAHRSFGGVGILALDGVKNHGVFAVNTLQIGAFFFLDELW